MKKCLIPITLILSVVLMTVFVSCSKDDDSRDSSTIERGCENFWQVVGEVDSYYNQCTSIVELAEHLPEITKIENVEDAYVSGSSLFISIKDFGTTSYAFFDHVEDKESATRSIQQIQKYKTRAVLDRTYINPDYALTTAVVSNAQYNEEGQIWTRAVSDAAVNMLNEIGIETEPNNDPDIDFFKNQIFKYDIVFHIGHGEYDDNQYLHWFITPKVVTTKKQLESIREQYTDKQVSTVTYEKKKYIKISERLFDTTDQRFKKPGKTIFLSVPCQSLMGGKISKFGDNNERDFSFADALQTKGLGLYVGYDEMNTTGQMAGLLYLGKLASGMSVDQSYKTLPYAYMYNKVEVRSFYIIEDEWEKWRHVTADLLTDYSDDYPELAEATLTRPVMDDIVGLNSQGGVSLQLTASAILFRDLLIDKKENEDYKDVYDDYVDDFKYAAFSYGFEYSDSPDFKNATQLSQMKVASEDKEKKAKCTYSKNKVKISQTVSTGNLKGNTNHYFRAYFYDGNGHYNYSEYKEFTKPEKTIDQVVPDDIRKTMEPYITIYDGDNPPFIEGTYLIDPMEIVHDATGNYQPGYNKFKNIYFKISNQNTAKNTLDYHEKEVGEGIEYSEAKGDGAFISGEGDNFSVYFNTEGVTHLENYDVNTKDALIISGAKTSTGIKDLHYSFVMVEKSADPEKLLMNAKDFRVFKDGDGNAKNASWPSLVRSQQITIQDGKIITPWSRYSVRVH